MVSRSTSSIPQRRRVDQSFITGTPTKKKASSVSELRDIQSRRDEVIGNSGMTPLNSIGQKISISISKISK